jgi:hypothetical protein
MGYAVYGSPLAFQRTDATGVAVGDEEIVEPGQQVPDYVRPYQLHALRAAGRIVDMGDQGDQPEGPDLFEQPSALPNPEVPPTLAGNPILHSLEAGPEELEAREGVSVPVERASRREQAQAGGKAVHDDEPESPQPGSGTAAKSPAKATEAKVSGRASDSSKDSK